MYLLPNGWSSVYFYRGKNVTKLILREIPKKSGQYFFTFCRILPNPAIKATSMKQTTFFYTQCKLR
jgi:hypothetical protein